MTSSVGVSIRPNSHPDWAGLNSFTSKEFRSTVGAFATGVTVVTTRGEQHAYGMTANAFSSVSLDPPLILVCAISPSEGADHIERNGVFAVNILGEEQEPISRYFSSRDRPRGRDAFRDVAHRLGTTGSPILDGVVGYLDCRVHADHDAGDHQIFIGEVLELGFQEDSKPLLFHGGQYRLIEGQ
jgi:flavin reductase (DIM6/NTAB) family NADH-FMN oxidoreductase RutF